MIIKSEMENLLSNQQLARIFSVERVLTSRGFTVQKEGSTEDTLLNKRSWTRAEADLVFSIFDKPELRAYLLDFIKDKIKEAQLPEDIKKLIQLDGFEKDRQRFSTTYEWYIGELFVREFMAFSSSFGVLINDIQRNSDGETSGDYDVLSVLGDMNLIYLECKSGKAKKSSIMNTLQRSISLHCTASIVVQQKITYRGLKQQLSCIHPFFGHGSDVLKLKIIDQPDSTIYKWFNCYFVDASESYGDIKSKLKTVLRIIEASKSVINMSMEPGNEQYVLMGYNLLKS